MPWLRHHYYCEACDGTWLVEAEIAAEADCRFCGAHDVFPYRSDDPDRVRADAAGMARRVLEKMRAAVRKPAGSEIRRARRAVGR